jgi:mannosyl-3-phosphoglycerate phosphatase
VRDGLLIVTDLDGTLLDETTYSFEPARAALDAVQAARIPLVIATSKTLAEVRVVANGLGQEPVLIVENGGAAIIPAAVGGTAAEPVVMQMGTPRHILVGALGEIATETAASVRGFHQLTSADVAELTGLSRDAARLACERQYDEPFLLDRAEDLAAVVSAASRRHLFVTRGDRFYHLTGPTSKGAALTAVLDYFAHRGRRFDTVGLGDAPNDLSFLRLVDRPIIVPRGGPAVDADLSAALTHAERAPDTGPRGWNLAILTVLAGRPLPRVSGAVV